MKRKSLLSALLFFLFAYQTIAQQQYANLSDALAATATLSGSKGPASVNWINGGQKYSYKSGENIKSFDPATQTDEIVFDVSGYKFPGTDKAFAYVSFEWSKDSKFIVFKSNLRPVWRNSGTSDYYLFSVAAKSLTLLVKDARTAQLSPDGLKVAYEKNGNLFMYSLESKKEKQLTKPSSSGHCINNLCRL